MALRDRIVDTRGVLVAAAMAAAWIGLSALFGDLGFTDYVVAAVLFVGGIVRSASSRRPPGADRSSLYGPPQ